VNFDVSLSFGICYNADPLPLAYAAQHDASQAAGEAFEACAQFRTTHALSALSTGPQRTHLTVGKISPRCCRV
jgi:hypothetical protein